MKVWSWVSWFLKSQKKNIISFWDVRILVQTAKKTTNVEMTCLACSQVYFSFVFCPGSSTKRGVSFGLVTTKRARSVGGTSWTPTSATSRNTTSTTLCRTWDSSWTGLWTKDRCTSKSAGNSLTFKTLQLFLLLYAHNRNASAVFRYSICVEKLAEIPGISTLVILCRFREIECQRP